MTSKIIHHVLWLSCQVLVSNPSEHQMHSVTFAKSIALIVLTDRGVNIEINCVKSLLVKVWDISYVLGPFCPPLHLPFSSQGRQVL